MKGRRSSSGLTQPRRSFALGLCPQCSPAPPVSSAAEVGTGEGTSRRVGRRGATSRGRGKWGPPLPPDAAAFFSCTSGGPGRAVARPRPAPESLAVSPISR